MPVDRISISGSPYLGVYLRVGETVALLPPSAPAAVEKVVVRLFGTPTVRTTADETEILGTLIALNSFGAVACDGLRAHEQARIERHLPVVTVRARHNAMGNNILANDEGAIVNPELSDEAIHAIHRVLQVPVARGTIAGLGTVGMAGIATNRGVVVHPRATPEEATRIAEQLRVPVYRSTANFGIPVVGACLVATSKAMLVGSPTTPVELVHLEEGLQIYD